MTSKDQMVKQLIEYEMNVMGVAEMMNIVSWAREQYYAQLTDAEVKKMFDDLLGNGPRVH